MSKQRLVDTCFWDDGYIILLDPSEKLLFLYLLTNPLTAVCGVYEISMRRLAFDTGFEADTVKRILDRFERDNRCIYRDGWIAMRNWIKHQIPGSPKIQRGIEIQLEKVPEAMKNYVTGIGYDTLSHLNLNPNSNPNPNPNSNSSKSSPPPAAQTAKQKPAPDPRIKKLIDYFFEAFKKRRGFEPTVNGGVWGNIFKRLLRESSEDTIRIVIDSFFAYDKRTRLSIHDFDRAYDNVFGRIYDLQQRRGNAQRTSAGR